MQDLWQEEPSWPRGDARLGEEEVSVHVRLRGAVLQGEDLTARSCIDTSPRTATT